MDVAAAPFDFADVVAEVGVSLKPLIDAKGLRLEFDMPGAADGRRPPQVLQVLLNLAGNAVKFTERGACASRPRARDGRLACRGQRHRHRHRPSSCGGCSSRSASSTARRGAATKARALACTCAASCST